MSDLSPKQQRFVEEYLVDLNATQAAIRAGYSPRTADRQGPRLLGNAVVQAAIAAGRARLSRKTGITQERVLAEYAKLAFVDPRKLYREDGRPVPVPELDDDTAAAVAGVEVSEEYEGKGEARAFVGYTRKIKLADKKGALDSIARHLGMFVDRTELSGPKGGPIHAVADVSDAVKRSVEEVHRSAAGGGDAPSVQDGPLLPAEVRDEPP